MTGRGERVTGDEPGTCKAVTGTPYAGAEQYQAYCKAMKPHWPRRGTPPARHPGLGHDGPATGYRRDIDRSAKGACEPLTGTPYVGADQYAQACPASPAEPGSPDFPQPMAVRRGASSVSSRPIMRRKPVKCTPAVTGTKYEQGHITGPFGMASGKVTGTEEARFGRGNGPRRRMPETSEMIDGRVKSRVTGEGMDSGRTSPAMTGIAATSSRARKAHRPGAATQPGAAR